MNPDFQDLIARTPLSAPFWAAIEEERLVFQQCEACAHAWLPARAECPSCLQPRASWVQASGRARLVSWVVYHTALHPAFEAALPYNVAVVELDEGPRLITNVVDARPDSLRIEQRLRMVVRERGGVRIPQFAPAD